MAFSVLGSRAWGWHVPGVRVTRGGLTSACCPGHWMHMHSCSGMEPISEGM